MSFIFRFLNKDRINQLPRTSGVYIFKKGREFLYIGKAKNLKERVRGHKELLSLATKLGYIKTDSEIEALILEAKLIKQYQPKYNVFWRDDKNYFYVGITKEDFPRVFITHQIKLKPITYNLKPEYIGPFVEGTSLKRTLTYLRKVFPYYASKKHPRNDCLWCSLKLCPGPNPVKSEYQKNIKNLLSVLKGNSKKVLSDLKREMNRLSAFQEYEKAANIRDKITALEKVISHARIFQPETVPQTSLWYRKRIEAYDISNIQGQYATGSMVIFINGKPDKNFYRRFKIKIDGKPNDVAMLKEVLSRRSKHPEWPYPDLILIDGGIGQLNVALKLKTENEKLKTVKFMALAKKKNELFIEGKKKPILLKSLPREVFNLILQLRDEAHRFAIAYHRKLRTKALIK